jgi:hypothetical protein
MKIITLLNKLFGANQVADFMETIDDEEATEVEFWSIDDEEDAAEPMYFVRVYANGSFKVNEINGNVLLETSNEKELKTFLKVLAAKIAK